MTIYEKLIEEFGADINAVMGDLADKEYNVNEKIDLADVDAISRKVKFYLGD